MSCAGFTDKIPLTTQKIRRSNAQRRDDPSVKQMNYAGFTDKILLTAQKKEQCSTKR